MLRQWQWLTAAAACATSVAASAASIVSTADSRLPMSLSTVVSDLEAEGCAQLSTACLIASRSLTRKQRVRVLEQLLDAGDLRNEQAGTADTWKAVAISSGLALAQPASCAETASAATVCGGTLLYYPDRTDLQRGEGLFDTLAPAMEKLLAIGGTSSLYVLIDEASDEATVRSKLEQAAASVVPNLISERQSVATLDDVFSKVVYLVPSAVVEAVTSDSQTTPTDVAARVAEIWMTDTAAAWMNSPMVETDLTPANLAAARKLGPSARLQLDQTVALIKDACTAPDGSIIFVPDFGELCDAAVQQSVHIDDDNDDKSALGKQIRANLRASLDAGLSDLFADQLELLQTASFEEFKRGLSKLLVSPNLQTDMEADAKKSVAAFAAAAKRLVPTKSAKSSTAGWNTAAAKLEYSRRLNEYVANRILAARASGKFKPLPRKGVTVGFHWLLPKPFGNDYRQEPWMVHATDNMVYIPPHKLADVSPDDAATGDWRNKIVPSPAGNDMLYMQ